MSQKGMVNVIIDQPDSDFYIKHYEPGSITLNTGRRLDENVLVFADQDPEVWAIHSLNEIEWSPVIAYQPELVVFGTGEQQIFPEAKVLLPLHERQIGLEIMHNRAACQTFNLLIDEGRKVVLALWLG